MAAQIRVVDETEMPAEPAVLPAAISAPAPVPAADPRVDVLAANIGKQLQAAEARFQALERAVQGVPHALGVMGGLSRALGSRALVSLALLGCLGLAGAQAWSPSWQGLATFGAYDILVFLPIVGAAYLRRE